MACKGSGVQIPSAPPQVNGPLRRRPPANPAARAADTQQPPVRARDGRPGPGQLRRPGAFALQAPAMLLFGAVALGVVRHPDLGATRWPRAWLVTPSGMRPTGGPTGSWRARSPNGAASSTRRAGWPSCSGLTCGYHNRVGRLQRGSDAPPVARGSWMLAWPAVILGASYLFRWTPAQHPTAAMPRLSWRSGWPETRSAGRVAPAARGTPPEPLKNHATDVDSGARRSYRG